MLFKMLRVDSLNISFGGKSLNKILHIIGIVIVLIIGILIIWIIGIDSFDKNFISIEWHLNKVSLGLLY